ncbi:MAG: protein-export chaperone SecB [Holosporales bacterium]|jgi:preprotein translocase subunit SecB|nr:protein-export chaperone SecB [Holosporales bacterium]
MTDATVPELATEPTSDFIVHVQYLKELSFNSPNPLEHFTDKEEVKPDINVNVQVNARHLIENMFEVLLEIDAGAKRKNSVMFTCKVQYAALISLRIEQHDNVENVRKILLEDCPHLIFPFARNIISDTTRDSGFPPLLLQPVDFVALNKSQNVKKEVVVKDVVEQVH